MYFWPCAPGNPHCAPSSVQARTCSRCQRPSLKMCSTTLGSQWKCCRQWVNQYHRSACLIHAHPPSQPRRELPACHCLSFKSGCCTCKVPPLEWILELRKSDLCLCRYIDGHLLLRKHFTFLPNIIFHISFRLCQLLSLHAGLLERYGGMSGLGWQCILDIFLSSVSPTESKSELSSQSHPVKSLLHAKYVEFLPKEFLLSGFQLEVGKSDLWPCRVLQLAARTEPDDSAPVFTACTQQTSGVHGPSAAKLLLTAIRLFPICVNGL